MIRTLIADDEALAREALRDILLQDGNFSIEDECCDGESAVKAIRNKKPDVVFLDVQMPVLDGFGVIDRVGRQSMPLTVFVTANSHYAARAFDAGALDYVLKPFNGERVQETIKRAKQKLKERKCASDVHERPGKQRVTARLEYLDRLTVKTPGRLLFLKQADIIWIEAAESFIKIHTTSECHVVRETMWRVEQRLDSNRFLRIHRSAIVNVEHVKELRPWYTGEYIVMTDTGKELTLSRSYKDRLKELVLDPISSLE